MGVKFLIMMIPLSDAPRARAVRTFLAIWFNFSSTVRSFSLLRAIKLARVSESYLFQGFGA